MKFKISEEILYEKEKNEIHYYYPTIYEFIRCLFNSNSSSKTSSESYKSSSLKAKKAKESSKKKAESIKKAKRGIKEKS